MKSINNNNKTKTRKFFFVFAFISHKIVRRSPRAVRDKEGVDGVHVVREEKLAQNNVAKHAAHRTQGTPHVDEGGVHEIAHGGPGDTRAAEEGAVPRHRALLVQVVLLGQGCQVSRGLQDARQLKVFKGKVAEAKHVFFLFFRGDIECGRGKVRDTTERRVLRYVQSLFTTHTQTWNQSISQPLGHLALAFGLRLLLLLNCHFHRSRGSVIGEGRGHGGQHIGLR